MTRATSLDFTPIARRAALAVLLAAASMAHADPAGMPRVRAGPPDIRPWRR